MLRTKGRGEERRRRNMGAHDQSEPVTRDE